MWCALANVFLQLAFATLVLLEAITVWQIIGIVLITAVLETLITIARQAFLPETVSPQNFPNAMALFITVRRTLQIVAPSLAGVAIVTIGVAGVLYLNVVAIAGMLFMLQRMRTVGPPIPAETLGLRADLGRGLSFVRAQPDLVAIFLLATIPIVLIDPYKPLMPVFARDVLAVGPAGYGLLMAAPGAGGLIGAALLTLFGSGRPGLLMLVSLISVSGALLGFAMSSAFAQALVAIGLVGLGLNVYKIVNQTLLQTLTPRHMMGRILGIYRMDKGLEPFGALVLGSAATLVGAPQAVAGAAVASGLCAIGVLLLRPSLRRLRLPGSAAVTIGHTIPPRQ